MILTCPECATSYFVDDGKIPPAGRPVRCANCGARWTARPGTELELSAAPEEGALAREPAQPREPPKSVEQLPGEALPKVFRAKADSSRKVRQAATMGVVWAATAAGLLILAALALVFRADVVRLWPRSAAAYASLGMQVNSRGLVLEQLKAEPALQGGRAALSITGQIRNIQDREATAPPLKINLLNKAGKAVATQIAHAADPRIPPGETRHFAISMLDPPSTAQDVEVTFAPEPAGKAAKGHVSAVKPAPPKASPPHKAAHAAAPPAHAEPAHPPGPPAKAEVALAQKPAPAHGPKSAPEHAAKPAAKPAPFGLRPASHPGAPVPVEAKPLPPDSPYALQPR